MTYHKIFTLLIISVLFCSGIQAQDCTEEKAAKTRGKWEPVTDYLNNVEEESKSVIAAVKGSKGKMMAIMDSQALLIKRAIPELTGIDGVMIRNIWGSSVVDSAYLAYGLYSHYYHYYCSNQRQLKRVSEANTNFQIGVNTLNQEEFLKKQHELLPTGMLLYSIPPAAGTVQGFPAFQMYSNGENPATWKERYAVLVTRNPNESPFVPVSKGEFYQLMRKLIQVKKDEQKTSIKQSTRIRPKEVLEAQLKAEMDEIDKSSLGQDAKTSRKNRLKQDFMTDEQVLEEKLKQVDKQYNGYLDILVEMENHFKHELDRPVFCREYMFNLNNLNTSLNKAHLYNDSLHGYMIVKMNPAYFRKNAEKWKPQFMLITWTRKNGYAFSVNLENTWRNKLDIPLLKSMLVK